MDNLTNPKMLPLLKKLALLRSQEHKVVAKIVKIREACDHIYKGDPEYEDCIICGRSINATNDFE